MIAEQEKLFTLHEAAGKFPEPPSNTTMHRWYTRGVHGVRLRVVRFGGRIYVPEDALDEFIAALNRDEAVPA